MRQIIVSKNEAGQRMDKLLTKYLSQAPKSFLYKMLRKKNITLNGKKAAGNEKLEVGDEVKLFLSEETIEKFSAVFQNVRPKDTKKLDILYEDEHILLVNKPCGMLSQKARESDTSLVEYVIAHLLDNGSITGDSLQSFRPSICNRLDRNTSGIVVAGKSLLGLQAMAEVLKSREIHKYYLCLTKGRIVEERMLEGYLTKDEKSNKVSITEEKEKEESSYIQTAYRPVSANDLATLLSVELLTGRSHQIRAHLSSEGHPLLGDVKYGGGKSSIERQLGLHYQMLHSYRLEMPKFTGELSYLSGRIFQAKPPKLFERARKELRLDYGDLEF